MQQFVPIRVISRNNKKKKKLIHVVFSNYLKSGEITSELFAIESDTGEQKRGVLFHHKPTAKNSCSLPLNFDS